METKETNRWLTETKEIREELSKIFNELGDIRTKMSQYGEGQEAIRNEVSDQIACVQTSVEVVLKRMNESKELADDYLKRIFNRYDAQETKLNAVQSSVDHLQSSVSGIGGRIDVLIDAINGRASGTRKKRTHGGS